MLLFVYSTIIKYHPRADVFPRKISTVFPWFSSIMNYHPSADLFPSKKTIGSNKNSTNRLTLVKIDHRCLLILHSTLMTEVNGKLAEGLIILMNIKCQR